MSISFAQRLIAILMILSMPPVLSAMSLEIPLQTQQALNWVFSGMVKNDEDHHYGYYVEIQRQQQQVHMLSALIQIETKTLVFVEESDATLPLVAGLNWQVGRSYFGFNPATHRVALGVKTANEQGFSLKIDTVNESSSLMNPQSLRSGLALNVLQMGQVHGHIVLGAQKDEFVTAKQAWFRQLDTKQATVANKPALTDVLCQFDDGSGFYAIHLPVQDAQSGFAAGWRDAKGHAVPMSQFVKITQALPHEWDLSISLPATHIKFSDLLSKQRKIGEVAAGVVVGKRPGFCTAGREKV